MQSPWKVIAAFVGVFIAGAVFGAFFTRGVAQWIGAGSRPVSAADGAREGGRRPEAKPGAGQARSSLLQVPQSWQAPQLMRRYAERLDLTAEQRQRIQPLFQRAAEDYRRVQQNTFRETGVILSRLQQDLARELNPEQRAKLKAWEQEQRERLRRFELRQREQRKNSGAPKAKQSGADQPSADAPEAGSSAGTAP